MPACLRALFLLLLFVALPLLPSAASAQSGKSVVVRQRDAEITIQPNGDADFVETWVVNFRNGSFTFAFREIPKNRLSDIVNWRVTEGGSELRVTVDETDEKIKATWYFPETNHGEKFISDIHTFTLRYTVQGAMRIYPDGDQFWWKFVERDRAYVIESARVNLHLPGNFPTDQILATTYTNGADSARARILDGSTIEFLGGPFPPDTEWEIRAQFPHVITAAPAAWQVRADRANQIAAQNNFYATVLGVSLLIGGSLLLLVLWYLYGRDKPTTFAAEFLNAPPDDTPPGVVGTLLDERADLQDILATVADLAQRRYLNIRESDVLGTPQYERTAKPDSKLAPFEQATLDALLRGMSMRRLDDVRGSFYAYINTLESAIYDEVVARGFFPRSPLATRNLYFKIGIWGAILVPLVGMCAYFFIFEFAPLVILPLIAIEIFFIGLLRLSRVMPKRTEKGALAYARWSAFKRYLANIEKYTALQTAQDQFSTFLPFAVAFGLDKSWIDKFKQTTAPAPPWYIPYHSTTTDSSAHERAGAGTSLRETNSDSRPASSSNPARPAAAPSLNQLANNSFLALNAVSSNMFDFINTSAAAFVAKPETQSTSQQISSGVGSVIDWVSTSSGSSSDSSSSWSGDSSSSSSSSSGGGGGGGGSSGFG